jgi:tetraacyldisaccharide 4'-kinase
LAGVLFALSKLYGFGVRFRNARLDRCAPAVRRLPVPVISVGNLTAGGTGKTPMVLNLAGELRRLGLRPAVVSRGYRGGAERDGGVVGDGERILLAANQAGDEPRLLAERLSGVPVVVGADRFSAGMTAISQFSPDLVLLDDGFQHRRLARDLDLVLLDARRPLGNGHLLPRGPLREPVPALKRAHALILTRSDRGVSPLPRAPGMEEIPVFRTVHRPALRKIIPAGNAIADGLPVAPTDGSIGAAFENGRRAFVFSGLADNADVLRTVATLGARPAGAMGFADHHAFSEADRESIFQAARECGANLLVTTEKDAVRLPGGATFPLDLAVVGVDIDFDTDENRFLDFLTRKLERTMTQSPRPQ